MGRLTKGLAWASALAMLLLLLLLLEAGGGHDGWLCEWGFATDGAGDLTTGCS